MQEKNVYISLVIINLLVVDLNHYVGTFVVKEMCQNENAPNGMCQNINEPNEMCQNEMCQKNWRLLLVRLQEWQMK